MFAPRVIAVCLFHLAVMQALGEVGWGTGFERELWETSRLLEVSSWGDNAGYPGFAFLDASFTVLHL